MKKLIIWDEYNCEINIRPEFNGMKPKEEYLKLNGQTLKFRCIWLQDNEDKYPNEYALELVEPILGIGWISSGDLEIIKDVL